MTRSKAFEWNKLSNNWFQKIPIATSTYPNITYHYKSKVSKPSKIIEINTKLSRQLIGYRLIEKDIKDAMSFYDEYLKIQSNGTMKENGILISALMRAIVITYGKCFVEAFGRRIKLETHIISKNLLPIHNSLLEIRNHFVAHAGNQFEHGKLVYTIPSKNKNDCNIEPVFVTEIIQIISPEYFKGNIKKLLVEVDELVKQKIAKLNKKFNQEFHSLSYNSFFEFCNKAKMRAKIEDNEWELLKSQK